MHELFFMVFRDIGYRTRRSSADSRNFFDDPLLIENYFLALRRIYDTRCM